LASSHTTCACNNGDKTLWSQSGAFCAKSDTQDSCDKRDSKKVKKDSTKFRDKRNLAHQLVRALVRRICRRSSGACQIAPSLGSSIPATDNNPIHRISTFIGAAWTLKCAAVCLVVNMKATKDLILKAGALQREGWPSSTDQLGCTDVPNA